eukprot:3648506-Rhodomonas_salina.1
MSDQPLALGFGWGRQPQARSLGLRLLLTGCHHGVDGRGRGQQMSPIGRPALLHHLLDPHLCYRHPGDKGHTGQVVALLRQEVERGKRERCGERQHCCWPTRAWAGTSTPHPDLGTRTRCTGRTCSRARRQLERIEVALLANRSRPATARLHRTPCVAAARNASPRIGSATFCAVLSRVAHATCDAEPLAFSLAEHPIFSCAASFAPDARSSAARRAALPVLSCTALAAEAARPRHSALASNAVLSVWALSTRSTGPGLRPCTAHSVLSCLARRAGRAAAGAHSFTPDPVFSRIARLTGSATASQGALTPCSILISRARLARHTLLATAQLILSDRTTTIFAIYWTNTRPTTAKRSRIPRIALTTQRRCRPNSRRPTVLWARATRPCAVA